MKAVSLNSLLPNQRYFLHCFGPSYSHTIYNWYMLLSYNVKMETSLALVSNLEVSNLLPGWALLTWFLLWLCGLTFWKAVYTVYSYPFVSFTQSSRSLQYQQQMFRGGYEHGSNPVSQSGPTRSPWDGSAGQWSQSRPVVCALYLCIMLLFTH